MPLCGPTPKLVEARPPACGGCFNLAVRRSGLFVGGVCPSGVRLLPDGATGVCVYV
jgi:hypothetical protein